MYTGPLCNYCEAAKRLLARNNAPYNEIDISKVDGAMDEMIKKANGKRTIPQIFFNDQHIGGYDEVRACLLYTSPSPRDATLSRMPSSA